ncbi:N-acetylmuramoyl-L-alanine amidase [Urechidicola croceus]|uniref:N-acetylmuramoyl-L-alanine amidase n=2 Tax=Urechidicola croceus TaxID=1850246 RepID=A0A1D8P6P7_9FLAO|nr:N-acetylmuramoyl-L-alanine amidase [Urechidicola croceus]
MFHKFNTKTNVIRLFVFFFFSILINLTSFAQNKTFTVVLDAGHGGHDPGKVGYKKYKEKDIALNVTLAVGKILEANDNIEVIYTRKKDVFVDLWVRGQIANKADADLFVSIHCNAHNSQAYGAETWVLGVHANKQNFEVAKKENEVVLLESNYKENYKGFDPNSPESVIGITLMQEEYLDQSLQLASIIQNNLTSDLKRKNRGVKQAGFIVLHQTYMPSVLIETGFITNKSEGTYLNSKQGQDKFAKTIASGIKKYLNEVSLNTVIDDISNTTIDEAKIYEGVIFKVQLASGSRKLETKSYNFKGLNDVERVKVGNFYKYYIGKTSDFNKIKNLQKQAKDLGYTSAFIVAFKNGEKISVTEAIKTH